MVSERLTKTEVMLNMNFLQVGSSSTGQGRISRERVEGKASAAAHAQPQLDDQGAITTDQSRYTPKSPRAAKTLLPWRCQKASICRPMAFCRDPGLYTAFTQRWACSR